ncbi:MAG: outer membrane lipoprotein-sorting protein [Desulfohalobiaceae bacterium]|nr:outer membrane lipoprotein-sorting protein [Desulfohalobiaceae bacterium]
MLLIWLVPCLASAQDETGLSGRELARRVHDRYVGDNFASEAVMILAAEGGDKRIRDMTWLSLEQESGLRRNFIRFTSPPDIAGTGFLSVEKGAGRTEQFLYLPALNRTRRIVTSQKGRSFVNSDFTYEDMQRRPVDDSEHTLAGLENVKGLECRVLETRPLPKAESEYTLIRSWIPKDIFLPVKMEIFNDAQVHIKSYQVDRLEKVEDIWTPLQYSMKDLRDGHETIIRIERIAYNTDINASYFTKRYLESW